METKNKKLTLDEKLTDVRERRETLIEALKVKQKSFSSIREQRQAKFDAVQKKQLEQEQEMQEKLQE